MKHPLKLLLYVFILAILIFACRDEFSNLKSNDRAQEIEDARAWYDAARSEELSLKSANADSLSVIFSPNWEEAYPGITKNTKRSRLF